MPRPKRRGHNGQRPEGKRKRGRSLAELAEERSAAREPSAESEDSDEEIRMLERKLGIQGNRRQLDTELEQDGLADLVAGFSSRTSAKRGRAVPADDSRDSSDEEDFDGVSDGERDASAQSSGDPSEEESEGASSSARASDAEAPASGSDSAANSEANVDSASSSPEESDADEKEAAPRGSSATVAVRTGKYIPPHMRAAAAAADRKAPAHRVRGLINRVTADNLPAITKDILALFDERGPKSDLTQAIASVIADQCNILEQRAVKRLVEAYGAVIAFLHFSKGIAVSAAVMEHLIVQAATYLHLENTKHQLSTGDAKAAASILSVAGHAAGFGAVHWGLLYDAMFPLAQRLGEFDAEVIVVLLTDFGSQMRSEDPVRMRDLVVCVRDRASSIEKTKRVQFMLETLCDVKNNKRRARPSSFPQIRKWIARVRQESGVHVPPLQASLDDLRHAEKQGRWWIVGAAFGETKSARAGAAAESSGSEQRASREPSSSLSSLEQRLHMHTRVRRSIFHAIMEANDYMHAFERCEKLQLRGTQRQEIVRVAVELCTAEKVFNPFYGHFIAHTIRFLRDARFTFQLFVWDLVKETGRLQARQAAVLGRLVCFLVANDAVNLLILKNIDLTMTKGSPALFSQSFVRALCAENESTIQSAVGAITDKQDARSVCDALLVVARHLVGPALETQRATAASDALRARASHALRGLATLASTLEHPPA